MLGFARAVLLAAAIGVTTDAADAFGVANQLPNNVYAIIVGGVLNAVLVPQLVKARGGLDGGKGYVDRFVTLAITVFFSVTLLFTIAAPLLIRLYTSGWSDDQLALATAFAYWCLPQLFFYGLYSVFGEVLNSRKAFGPFMWAPVLNNVVSLAGLVAFIVIFAADPTGVRSVSEWGADRIALLAGSATLGVAAQALILLVSWRRIGLKLNLNFHWRGFGLGPALRAASWSLGMVLVTQIGGLVQTAVASTAAAQRDSSPAIASVAAAAIAWLIFMLPHSVVTVSIATAYFTRMAEHNQAGREKEFKVDLTTGLRVIRSSECDFKCCVDCAQLPRCEGVCWGVSRHSRPRKRDSGVHDWAFTLQLCLYDAARILRARGHQNPLYLHLDPNCLFTSRALSPQASWHRKRFWW
jgi:putative peptidoglycan lipid II flippase